MHLEYETSTQPLHWVWFLKHSLPAIQTPSYRRVITGRGGDERSFLNWCVLITSPSKFTSHNREPGRAQYMRGCWPTEHLPGKKQAPYSPSLSLFPIFQNFSLIPKKEEKACLPTKKVKNNGTTNQHGHGNPTHKVLSLVILTTYYCTEQQKGKVRVLALIRPELRLWQEANHFTLIHYPQN